MFMTCIEMMNSYRPRDREQFARTTLKCLNFKRDYTIKIALLHDENFVYCPRL